MKPITREAFVANRFVRKMFREMKMNQDEKYYSMSDLVEKNVAKLGGFLHIADVAFPKVRQEASNACE